MFVGGCVLAGAPVAASGATFGSSLRARPNLGFGCKSALIRNSITGAPTITPSGQRTCTYRNLGFLNRPGSGSLAPATGRVTSIRVRSGRNPAPLRLTILSSSPGRSCCTAIFLGRPFRPRANAITRIRTNVKIRRVLDPGTGVASTDVVAISAVGPGSLPLHYAGGGGTFADGSPLTSFWYPLTRPGDPRVDGYTMDGLELLFQWTFRPGR